MLKAKFHLVQFRTLKKAVEKFSQNNPSQLRLVAVSNGLIGDSQAVMSAIGILADMGEDSLNSCEKYSEKDFKKYHE